MDQEALLFIQLVFGVEVLFAAPTCTPWGGHSRSWSPADRRSQRQHQKGALKFLAMACFLQTILGRSYMVEHPHNSDI